MVDGVTVLLYCARYPQLTLMASQARGDPSAERAFARVALRLVAPQSVTAMALWELRKAAKEPADRVSYAAEAWCVGAAAE